MWHLSIRGRSYLVSVCVGSTHLWLVPHTCLSSSPSYVPIAVYVLHFCTFHIFVWAYAYLYSTNPRTFCIFCTCTRLCTHTFHTHVFTFLIFVRSVYPCVHTHVSLRYTQWCVERTHASTFYGFVCVRNTCVVHIK